MTKATHIPERPIAVNIWTGTLYERAVPHPTKTDMYRVATKKHGHGKGSRSNHMEYAWMTIPAARIKLLSDLNEPVEFATLRLRCDRLIRSFIPVMNIPDYPSFLNALYMFVKQQRNSAVRSYKNGIYPSRKVKG